MQLFVGRRHSTATISHDDVALRYNVYSLSNQCVTE